MRHHDLGGLSQSNMTRGGVWELSEQFPHHPIWEIGTLLSHAGVSFEVFPARRTLCTGAVGPIRHSGLSEQFALALHLPGTATRRQFWVVVAFGVGLVVDWLFPTRL